MKRYILGIISLQFLIITPAEQKEFVVCSYNIDTNMVRTEEGFARDAHPEWRIKERIPHIIKTLQAIIKRDSPDLIHLQEGRRCTTRFGDEIDSVTPLMDFLKTEGYQVWEQPYNLTGGAVFSFITALKENYIKIDNQFVYITESRQPTDHSDHALRLQAIKKQNFGEEYERCLYITKFKDKENNIYYSCNLHLGLGLEHRKKASEVINEWAEKVKKENPKAHIIITGDFNTFSDWGGQEQLAIIKDAGVLTSATDTLKIYGTDRIIDSSFFPFPHDFGAQEKSLKEELEELKRIDPVTRKLKMHELFKTKCKALGDKLDHVFVAGFKKAQAYLSPFPLFSDGPIEYLEHLVKDYVLGHHINSKEGKKVEGPAFASDHQPVITFLEK